MSINVFRFFSADKSYECKATVGLTDFFALEV